MPTFHYGGLMLLTRKGSCAPGPGMDLSPASNHDSIVNYLIEYTSSWNAEWFRAAIVLVSGELIFHHYYIREVIVIIVSI